MAVQTADRIGSPPLKSSPNSELGCRPVNAARCAVRCRVRSNCALCMRARIFKQRWMNAGYSGYGALRTSSQVMSPPRSPRRTNLIFGPALGDMSLTLIGGVGVSPVKSTS